jgi:tetratricopeptide (TPR) repeat protein
LAEDSADLRTRAECLHTAGEALARVGDFDGAVARLSEAASASQEIGDTVATVMSLARLASVRKLKGDDAQLIAGCFGEQADIKFPKPFLDAVWMHTAAIGCVAVGELRHAYETFETARKLFRSINNKIGEARVLVDHAAQLIEVGKTIDASKLLSEAFRLADEAGDAWTVISALKLVYLASLKEQMHDFSLQTIQIIIDKARGYGNIRAEAEGHLGLAKLHEAAGHTAQVVESARRAAELFDTLADFRAADVRAISE